MDASNRSGKLFFCFNSPFFSSSSSMNISSRSILSPARHRDHPLSLSASLSRRLRSDGGQSPMFPTTAVSSKKRTAGGLENPEPSSPKVTCIGQVRVKSKKKKKNINKHARKLRNPSRRRSGGDGSFRRMDNWGSVDLSFSQTNIPENRHRNQRWVHLPFTICEGLKGLGAEISCLSSSCFSSSSKRGIKRERSNLEKMEISREKLEANKLDAFDDEDREEEEEEEEEGRVSVCVPPKNALLLMRCRSDPMRMAALSRRLLESPSPNGDDEEEGTVEKGECFDEEGTMEKGESFNEDRSVMDVELHEEGEEKEEDGKRGSTEEGEIEQNNEELEEEEEEDGNRSLTMEEEEEEDSQKGSRMDEEEEEDIQIGTTMEAEEEKEIELKCEDLAMECEMETVEEEKEEEEHESRISDNPASQRERPPPPPLPKVSTEISKETWVCTTDFIQFLPHRHRPANKTLADIDEPEKKKLNPTNTNPSRPKPESKQSQPPRSSCSIPGNAAPMPTTQKLPRCKSEPMRTAAAKLVPSETCIGF